MATETQLRNRSRLLDALASLPVNFEWAFNTVFEPEGQCGTVGCAIGLAMHLGMLDDQIDKEEYQERLEEIDNSDPEEIRNAAYSSLPDDARAMANALGISWDAAYDVFLSTHPYYNKLYHLVTPAEVAKALQRVIQEEDNGTI